MNHDVEGRNRMPANAGRLSLRVLHAAKLGTVGGVQVVLRNYVNHPDSHRHEHHLLAVNGRLHPDLRASLDGFTGRIFRRSHWGWEPLAAWPKFIRRLNLLRMIRSLRPDVVVVWDILGSWWVIEAAHRLGVPTLYFEAGGAWQAGPIRMGHAQELITAFTGCSRAAKRFLELRHHIAPAKIDAQAWYVGGGAIPQPRTPRQWDRRQPVRLGVAARLIPLKGLPLAIHAVAHLKQAGLSATLEIAGDGPDAPALSALAERLGVSGQVKLLGRVTDMDAFYRRVDILVSPSLREPLGNVCVEAAARGCAVIGAMTDGHPEAIVHGETGFCLPCRLSLEEYEALGGSRDGMPEQVYDPSADALRPPQAVSPDDIAQTVRRLVEEPGLYERMSEAGRQFAREQFAPAVHVQFMNLQIQRAAGR